MSRECANGCDTDVLHPNPEWAHDEDMKLCSDCLIGALEERVTDAEAALEEAEADLAEAKAALK